MNTETIIRLIYLIVLFTTLIISAYYRRKARLQGETIHRNREGLLILLARVLLGSTVLFFLLSYPFYPDFVDWSFLTVPSWIRWIGILAAMVCPFLSFWLFKNIGLNISETVLTKQNHQLVTSGPYKYIRHPLYLTGILLIFSLGTISENWVLLFLAPLTFLIFRFIVIPKEEEKLMERFGQHYVDYRKTTGALFPKFQSTFRH